MKISKKITVFLLALTVNLLILAGCGNKTATDSNAPASGTAPEKTSVVAIGEFDPQISGQQIIAQEKGYFAEEGLDVDLKLLTDPSISTSMVASGEAQFYSISNYQAINLVDKGGEVHLLAPVVNAGNTQVVVAGPKFDVKSAKDLEGKKMGYTDGAGVIVAVKNMCKEQGVDFEKIKLVNLQASDMLAALEKGEIDFFAAWEPWGIKAEEFGGKVLFTGTKSYLPEKNGDVNWLNFIVSVDASKKFVEQNPEAAKAYLRAIIKATDYINNNMEDAAAIIGNKINLDKEMTLKIMKKNVYKVGYDNTFRSSCDELAAYMKEAELNTSLVKFDQYANTDILKSVDSSLVTQ